MNQLVQPDRHTSERLPALVDDWGTGLTGPGGMEPQAAGDAMQARGRMALLWLLDVVLKHKLLIASVCLLAAVGGFIKASLTTPVYEAATTIQIDQQAPRVLSNRQQGATDDVSREPFFFQTQYELLKSRSLAERVAKGLDPADAAALTRPPPPSLLGRLRGLLSGSSPAAIPPPASADAIEANQARVAVAIMGGLSVQPVPMSRMVRIAFASPDPALARKVSIAVSESFVALTLDRRVSASTYARTFFEERLQQLKLKLEESEKQVVAYARKEGIATVDEKQPELTSRLASINTALSAVTAERIRAEQLWAQAQAGNGLGLPQVLADRTVQTAREKRGALMTEYQDKLNIMKPAFPEMVALRNQIAELDRQIKAQIDLVRESIRSQYETARAQEQSLTVTLAELRDRSLDLRTRSIQYNILQRELDTNKSLYEGLLQQYKELGVAAGLGTNNVTVVDRAEMPGGAISPNVPRTVVISVFLGLIAAFTIVYVLELLDDTFKGPETIEETLGLTALGVIPTIQEDTAALIQSVATEPQSAIAEAYRSLRTALQFSTENGMPRVLLVTSAKPSEGKSVTSVSLATNLAQLGLRVLLIDADLRNPSIGRYVHIEKTTGLSNYLAGGAEIAEVTQTCFIENVSVITAGPVPPNPAELLAGPKLPALIRQTTDLFDAVIIDGPPVMGLADAPILSSIVPGTLLVVQANATRRSLVRAAVKRLRFARARIVGTVLSRFDVTKSGYTYSYSNYAYSYAYGRQGIDVAKKPALAKLSEG